VSALFLLPAMIILWQNYRPVIDKKMKIMGFLTAAFSFSPYFLFDLRHNFLVTRSFFHFVSNRQGFYHSPFGEILKNIFRRYVGEFKMMVLPISQLTSALLVLGIILLLLARIKKSGFFSKKAVGEKMLGLWLVSAPPLGLFVWGGFHLKHYMVGVAPAMIIATAFLIDWLMKRKTFWLAGALLLVFLLSVNLYVWRSWLPVNREVFYLQPQPASLLGREKRVIDYVYQEAGGKKFSYRVFAVPYEMEHAWEYLFEAYGRRKYGYLPDHTNREPGDFYLILEPGGDLGYRQNWRENKVGSQKPLKTAEFDGLLVESYFK
jgi:hypothetical protein